MLTSTRWLPLVAALVIGSWSPRPATAQQDRIYPSTGDPINGAVDMVSKDGITIKTRANTEAISVDKIDKVMLDGDPSALTRGREFVLDGQFQQALEELKKVDTEDIRRQLIKTDAEFYRALAQARLALTGGADRTQAAKEMLEFYKAHGDSWHFAEAAETLGDLARAMGNFKAARTFYGAMGNVRATPIRIESVYLTALTQLREGEWQEALEAFDKIIGVQGDSTAILRLQQLAQAGRVAALGSLGKTAEAIEESGTLIQQLDTTDTELTARLYNARGQTFEQASQPEDASIAYLHTTLLCSAIPDAHAEALSRLIPIWNALGRPERANAARQELQQRYPGWGG